MSNWRDGDNEGDEEEEDNENDYRSAEDRIIFLIDARSDMFEKNNRGEVHFENCVKVALAVMKTKIVASDKSSIGIIFFGTKQSNSSTSSQGVYSLFSLDTPSASRIRELQEGIVDDMSIFHRTIGSSPSSCSGSASYCPLHEAFWACSGAFSAKSHSHKQNDFRRIWLFTNDDNPNGSNSADQDRIIQASRDCSESGIELSLWHMNRADRPFEPERFYTKLLTVGGSESNDSDDGIEDYIENKMKGAGYDGFDMMMANIRRKEHRKRTLGHVMFSLGGGEGAATAAAEVQIALQMYKTVSITVRPSFTWLFMGTNEPLKSNSRMYDSRTGATLDESMVETFLPINEFTRISFTADELQTIKQSRGAGLALLYFASKSVITPELNISSPYFMFPDEKRVQGSTSLFAVLVKDLAQRGLVAIVKFVRTAAAMPRIAALIPQMETLSEEGIQLLPLGMNLVPLPFDEEISVKYSEAVSEEGFQAAAFQGREAADAAAVDMINALTIDTAPYQTSSPSISHADREKMCYYRDMSNPALQQFYSVLQAIALVENLPDNQQQREQDLLKPYFSLEPQEVDAGDQSEAYQAMVRKRAVMRFKDSVGLPDDAVALSEGPKSKKRPAAAEKKSSAGAEEIREWKELVASDGLKSLSVADLKEICVSLAVPVSGVKKVLTQRIEDTLQKL